MKRPSKHAPPVAERADRNLRFGWWSLLVFLSLGAVLETLHGFKIGWYIDVGNETRRLMFTLAHAHGTLLAVVNIAAGLTARIVDRFTLRPSVSFARAAISSHWLQPFESDARMRAHSKSFAKKICASLTISHEVLWECGESSHRFSTDSFFSHPERAIEGAVLDRFADVLGSDVIFAVEIGNRARDFEDAIVSACT